MLPPVRQFVASDSARVYRIACRVMAGLTARVYLMLGAGPPTLVDTGSGEAASNEDIAAGLSEVALRFGEPFSPGDIRRIILTHAHGDHFGGLGEWVRCRGGRLEVMAHRLDAEPIERWDEHAWVLRRRLERLLDEADSPPELRAEILQAAGYEPGRFAPVPITAWLDDGAELDGIHVVHTPGHSPGHVCLRLGDILLCADHLLAQTVPQQWPEWLLPGTGLERYFHSLDRVERLEGVRLALPAHEAPIEDVGRRIAAIRASHYRRLDRLVDLPRTAGRAMSLAELTEQSYPASRGLRAFLAFCDTAARVEYLVRQGRLVALDPSGAGGAKTPGLRFRPT